MSLIYGGNVKCPVMYEGETIGYNIMQTYFDTRNSRYGTDYFKFVNERKGIGETYKEVRCPVVKDGMVIGNNKMHVFFNDGVFVGCIYIEYIPTIIEYEHTNQVQQ